MAAVSMFTGEVNRTWRFIDASGRKHEASLYHHTISGARAAMVDYEELEGFFLMEGRGLSPEVFEHHAHPLAHLVSLWEVAASCEPGALVATPPAASA